VILLFGMFFAFFMVPQRYEPYCHSVMPRCGEPCNRALK
jgi:hypothetical protein